MFILKITLKLVATIFLLSAFMAGWNFVNFLLNQNVDFFFVVGLATIPLVFGAVIYLLGLLWGFIKIRKEKVNDETI